MLVCGFTKRMVVALKMKSADGCTQAQQQQERLRQQRLAQEQEDLEHRQRMQQQQMMMEQLQQQVGCLRAPGENARGWKKHLQRHPSTIQ